MNMRNASTHRVSNSYDGFGSAPPRGTKDAVEAEILSRVPAVRVCRVVDERPGAVRVLVQPVDEHAPFVDLALVEEALWWAMPLGVEYEVDVVHLVPIPSLRTRAILAYCHFRHHAPPAVDRIERRVRRLLRR